MLLNTVPAGLSFKSAATACCRAPVWNFKVPAARLAVIGLGGMIWLSLSKIVAKPRTDTFDGAMWQGAGLPFGRIIFIKAVHMNERANGGGVAG